MFVKIYEYHVKNDKADDYLRLQTKTLALYAKHIDSRTTYLRSRRDPSKWIEMSFYKNEADYNRAMGLINGEPGIDALFSEFQGLLVGDDAEIREEEFDLVMGNSPGDVVGLPVRFK